MDERLNTWQETIAQRLQARFPELGARRIQTEEGSVLLSDSTGSHVLTIHLQYNEWVVSTEEGHVHLKGPDEAVDIVTLLLLGEARFTCEYRGDVLASAWLEVKEGDRYRTEESVAYFLSPFDADEWDPWPGDVWKQVRTTRNLVRATGVIEASTQERVSDSPTLKIPETVDWLQNGLGAPPEGLKWTVFGDRFLFLAPRGWRRVQRDNKDNWVDLAGREEGMIFRARNYFRDAESPSEEMILKAVKPLSTDRAMGDTDSNWVQHTWTMIFSNGHTEMMGILDFFYLPAKEAAAKAVFSTIESGIGRCLFVPEQWDMTADEV